MITLKRQYIQILLSSTRLKRNISILASNRIPLKYCKDCKNDNSICFSSVNNVDTDLTKSRANTSPSNDNRSRKSLTFKVKSGIEVKGKQNSKKSASNSSATKIIADHNTLVESLTANYKQQNIISCLDSIQNIVTNLTQYKALGLKQIPIIVFKDLVNHESLTNDAAVKILLYLSMSSYNISDSKHRILTDQTINQIVIDQLSLSQLIFFLRAVVKLGYKTADISSNTQNQLVQSITAVVTGNTSISARQYSELLYCLRKLEFRFIGDTFELRKLLVSLFPVVAKSIMPLSLPSVLLTFGHFGVEWESLETSIQEAIIFAIINNCRPELTAHGLTNLMQSLAMMRVPWFKINKSVTDAISDSIFLKYHNNYGQVTGDCYGITNIVYSFYRLGCSWKTLDVQIQSSIEQGIIHFSKYLTSNQFSLIILNMGNIKANFNQMSDNYRDAIANTLIRRYRSVEGCKLSSKTEFLNIIEGLSKNSCAWDKFDDQLKSALQCGLLYFSDNLLSSDLTFIIITLSEMKMIWSDMDEAFVNLFSNHIINQYGRKQNCMTANSRDLAYLVLGLGKIDCNWNEFNSNLKSALLNGIIYYFNKFSLIELSLILSGMKSINASMLDMTIDYVAELSNALIAHYSFEENYKYIDPAVFARIIYSLGKCGYVWDTLSGDLRISLEKAAIYYSKLFSSAELSITLLGMSFMKAKWSDMNDDYVISMSQCAITVFSTPNLVTIKHITNSVFALGKGRCLWNELDENLKITLLTCIAYFKGKFNFKDLSTIVYSMGLMQADWNEMNKSYIECITDGIIKNYSNSERCSIASSHSIANVVYGLGYSHCIWKDLPADLKSSIAFGIKYYSNDFTSQGVSNVALGFALMESNNVPFELFQTLLQSLQLKSELFSTQEVANIMYSLALITFDQEFVNITRDESLEKIIHDKNSKVNLTGYDRIIIQIHETMITDIFPRSYLSMNASEIRQVAIYFSVLSTTSWGRDLLSKQLGPEGNKLEFDEAIDIAKSFDDDLGDLETDIDTESELLFDKPFESSAISLVNSGSVRLEAVEEKVLSKSNMRSDVPSLMKGFENVITHLVDENSHIDIEASLIHKQLSRQIIITLNEYLGNAYVDDDFSDNSGHEETSFASALRKSKENNVFTYVNEYYGLLYPLYPIDSVICYNGKIVCFVEIDGPFHYLSDKMTLKRKSAIKDYLYKYHYPHIPLFRLKLFDWSSSADCTIAVNNISQSIIDLIKT